LLCPGGAGPNAPTTPDNNIVDIFGLKKALNVSAYVDGALGMIEKQKGMLNQTAMLQSALTQMASMDKMLQGGQAMDGLAKLGNISAYTAPLTAAKAKLPSVGSDGRFDLADTNTQTKLQALSPALDIAALQQTLDALNTAIALPPPSGLGPTADVPKYTLSNMGTLDTTAVESPPLSTIQNPATKSLLEAAVPKVAAVTTIMNALAKNVSKMQASFAQVSAQTAGVQQSMRLLAAVKARLLAEKRAMETKVKGVGDSMTATAGTVDTMIGDFRALVPAMKNSMSDYTHCGWVGKSYRSLVQVAVCQSTVKGLHDIGIYMLAGAFLFFLSFYVHMHGAGYVAARNDHGYEMVKLQKEFSGKDGDDVDDGDLDMWMQQKARGLGGGYRDGI
jgi:hypothetical protein